MHQISCFQNAYKDIHKFHDFLKYINGDILECYMKEYPGFDRPMAIDCKIQKTQPGEGYHVWHCENAEMKARNRILAFSVYLNDVAEGGETEFLYQGVREKPSTGDVLIFPCQYTHVHRGNPPIGGVKYLATTWGWIQSNENYEAIV